MKKAYSLILGAVVFASSMFCAAPAGWTEADSTSGRAGKKGYRVFHIKINVAWQVNKDRMQASSTSVFEAVGSGTIDVSLYFPPAGGEALKNSALGKIVDYKFNNNPVPVTVSGVGLKNESISFYRPVWDGKNTITISGVEYTAIPVDVTINNPSPVRPVTISDKSVWDRMLGAFTKAPAPGKINEFKLNTSPSASNYFPKVYFNNDWHYADLTFIVEEKGTL